MHTSDDATVQSIEKIVEKSIWPLDVGAGFYREIRGNEARCFLNNAHGKWAVHDDLVVLDLHAALTAATQRFLIDCNGNRGWRLICTVCGASNTRSY